MIEYNSEGIEWLEAILSKKLNRERLVFADLVSTSEYSIAFWDGKSRISAPLNGIILVAGKDDKQKLLDQHISDFKCPIRATLFVCDRELPAFFWTILQKVITPSIDYGKNLPSGDGFTEYSGLSSWVSSFTSLGRNVRLGASCLLGISGVATYYDPHSLMRRDIPHLGALLIGDNVRISSNVVISRAILSKTLIGSNSVIGTSSVIGHNVTVGSNCFIGPNVTICGSVTLEDNISIGAGSVLTNGIYIPQGSIICAGSVVTKSFQTPVKLIGNPARSIPL